MDFFDLKTETPNQILKNRVDDHEARIKRLEEQLIKTGLCQPKFQLPQGEPRKLPDSWMYIADFAEKFAFMSDSFLRNQIRDHADFFKDDMMAIGSMHYINPLRVIEFMERKMTPSAKVNKQYQHWKNLSPELGKMVNDVKNKLAKENMR